MSTNKSHILLRLLKKTVKFSLYTILAVFILANLFILLSGRTYMYKGIRHTYLVGKTGPGIYDLDVFPNADIAKSDSVWTWKMHPASHSNLSTKSMEDYHSAWDTKAFLVFKKDTLIYEKYYDEHTTETVSNSFSSAKTIVALLIGVALGDGKIKNLDESISAYIPEFRNTDVEQVTIRDLLYMSSGLDWTESGKNPFSNNAESYYGSDLRGLVTRQKLIREPGKTFIYQSGNSQLLSFIVEKATGQSINHYLEERIWKPIGAESRAYWSMDKENGDEKAFCCLYATARDYGKIGRLIMQNGRWNGQQLIPEQYMREMKMLPNDIETEEGLDNHQYGYHIWIYEGQKHPVHYCRGILGQYIITIPDEDLVIVRLGTKRTPDFQLPTVKEARTMDKIQLVGHPSDLLEYIKFARTIAAKIEQKN